EEIPLILSFRPPTKFHAINWTIGPRTAIATCWVRKVISASARILPARTIWTPTVTGCLLNMDRFGLPGPRSRTGRPTAMVSGHGKTIMVGLGWTTLPGAGRLTITGAGSGTPATAGAGGPVRRGRGMPGAPRW